MKTVWTKHLEDGEAKEVFEKHFDGDLYLLRLRDMIEEQILVTYKSEEGVVKMNTETRSSILTFGEAMAGIVGQRAALRKVLELLPSHLETKGRKK